jgi:competence protein ComEA
MRKSLHIFALTLLILSVATVSMADAAPAPAPAGVVNINNADAAQLAMLPRVGEKAAQRIIAYRTEHGPFHKTADLMQVKGFGAKTFEKLSTYVVIEGRTTLAAKVSGPRKARTKKPTTPASN